MAGKSKQAGKAGKPGPTGKAGERHNAAFVVGSVLGGVVGAAAALWKAPQTGDDLRHRLTSGGGDKARSGRVVSGVRTGSGRVLGSARSGWGRVAGTGSTAAETSSSGSTTTVSTGQFSNRMLSLVEKAAAPIVGVKLGRTANGSGPAASGTPVRITPIRSAETTPSATEPPVRDEGSRDRVTFGTYSGRSTAASSPTGGGAASGAATTTGQTETSGAATPSAASTDIPEGVPGHVPTTDELVTPTTPFVPEKAAQQAPQTQISRAFPDTGDTNEGTDNA